LIEDEPMLRVYRHDPGSQRWRPSEHPDSALYRTREALSARIATAIDMRERPFLSHADRLHVHHGNWTREPPIIAR
jgi:hypothetical protein